MNLLITGGLGFIGSNFLKFLEKRDDVKCIVNVDCETYAANHIGYNGLATYIHYPLNINDDIENILKLYKITHLIHLAAESHVDNSIVGPKKFINTNVNGTFSLLEASRNYGKLEKFLHVSTDEVYGSLSTGKADENYKYNPSSPYSASKAASDHLCLSYEKTYGLPVCVTHSSNNYGPWQHQEKMIPKAISNLLNGRKVPIYGDGSNMRDWLFVEDNVNALWKVLNHGQVGETYNIGYGCGITNYELIEYLCKLMDKSFKDSVEFVTDRPGHDLRYAVDSSKLKYEMNWWPEWPVEYGLKKTIEWYTSLRRLG